MYHTEGIVLKKLDIGEADGLYALYTRDCGKVVARAAGIRKNGAKLRGHLESLSLSSVRLITGKNGERLIGATLVNFWPQMRSREANMRLAAYVARRVDEQCFPGERDPALWELLQESFFVLDRDDFSDERAERFLREFDSGLSRCLGHGDDGADARAPLMAPGRGIFYNGA